LARAVRALPQAPGYFSRKDQQKTLRIFARLNVTMQIGRES
jgi:hypothetical protein